LKPERYTYPRYLRSKRTVDDRALNRGVMEAALRALPDDRPARIVELGGGVGTMIDRLVEGGHLTRAEYLLVDAEAEFLEEVRDMAPRWKDGATRERPPAPGCSVEVTTHHGRLEEWLSQTDATFDLIIVHAVLDLVDVRTALPLLLDRLSDGGVLWTTINFDGDTIFMPKDPRDETLIAAYHRSMDERTGSSTAGRELFGHVREAGGTVVRSGSSDWVVFDDGSGYVGDEAYFVHHIIHTVEEELKTRPPLREIVQDWGELRHAQVDRGELVYIAHQLDFAIRR
jgi:SAM-dependent methyltransferase